MANYDKTEILYMAFPKLRERVQTLESTNMVEGDITSNDTVITLNANITDCKMIYISTGYEDAGTYKTEVICSANDKFVANEKYCFKTANADNLIMTIVSSNTIKFTNISSLGVRKILGI